MFLFDFLLGMIHNVTKNANALCKICETITAEVLHAIVYLRLTVSEWKHKQKSLYLRNSFGSVLRLPKYGLFCKYPCLAKFYINAQNI